MRSSPIDARDGHVVWDTTVPGDPLGGATVVNDLVFTALLDGTVVALDRADGKIVWKHKADGGINGWMAAVDDTLYVPVGQSDSARDPRAAPAVVLSYASASRAASAVSFAQR